MELKVFIKKFFKFLPVLLIFVIFGGLAGAVFNSTQKPVAKTQISVYFSPARPLPLASTANEFTDTILGILQSQNLGDGQISPRKVAPQIIEFEITAESREKVLTASENLPQNLGLALGQTLGENQVGLTPLTQEVEIDESQNLLLLNILVGALAGFAIGASIVSTIIYFKS